jgi:hypothetical protein
MVRRRLQRHVSQPDIPDFEVLARSVRSARTLPRLFAEVMSSGRLHPARTTQSAPLDGDLMCTSSRSTRDLFIHISTQWIVHYLNVRAERAKLLAQSINDYLYGISIQSCSLGPREGALFKSTEEKLDTDGRGKLHAVRNRRSRTLRRGYEQYQT